MTYPGHTTTMFQLIKTNRLLHTSTGQPRNTGDVRGVSDEVAATRLARMQNWWALAQAVLSAEFPGFDVVRCFSAFDLPRVEGGGLAHLRLVPRDALIRVAGFWALDPEGLVAEFQDVRIVAERLRQTTYCPNASDWVTAVHETQTSRKRRAYYKVRNLLPALRRYMVYSGSSSGVEQCFSKMQIPHGGAPKLQGAVQATDLGVVRFHTSCYERRGIVHLGPSDLGCQLRGATRETPGSPP